MQFKTFKKEIRKIDKFLEENGLVEKGGELTKEFIREMYYRLDNHEEFIEAAKAKAMEDAKDKKQDVTEERGKVYGEFSNIAELSQLLKATFNEAVITHGQFELFTDTMNEAIEMILHKLSRIATGNPLLVDNARDIAGYAKLLEEEIAKQKEAIDTKVEYIKVND